jgi:hypothetical protein
MRTFSIEGRKDSPSIFIDESNNMVEISGDSTLKETNWFYTNVLRWIVALNNNSLEKKTVIIKLKKVNVSSLKWLKILFQKLRQYCPSTMFEINWYVEGNSRNATELSQQILNKPGLIVNLI